MLKSKFFCVAVAGLTATDGRTIEPQWIEDIAAGYNRATYGARINMEHIRGYSAEAPFNAYGDVLSVKKDFVNIELNGKTEKRLALYAEIQPTPELVALTKKGQKIYTSIEVSPNFAGTNKANLVGLAVTDSPASLGTDILAFSATKDNAAAAQLRQSFDARKQDPANVFSSTYETKIEFEDDAPVETAFDKFVRLAVEKLSGTPAEPKIEPKIEPVVTPAAAPDFAKLFTDMSIAMAADRTAADAASEARFAKLATEFGALKADLEKTPNRNHTSRPDASGTDGRVLADC